MKLYGDWLDKPFNGLITQYHQFVVVLLVKAFLFHFMSSIRFIYMSTQLGTQELHGIKKQQQILTI